METILGSAVDISDLGSSFGHISLDETDKSVHISGHALVVRNRHIVDNVLCAVMHCISSGKPIFCFVLTKL